MSKLVTRQSSVLIGVVPLFAVSRITLTENYDLPPVGGKGRKDRGTTYQIAKPKETPS